MCLYFGSTVFSVSADGKESPCDIPPLASRKRRDVYFRVINPGQSYCCEIPHHSYYASRWEDCQADIGERLLHPPPDPRGDGLRRHRRSHCRSTQAANILAPIAQSNALSLCCAHQIWTRETLETGPPPVGPKLWLLSWPTRRRMRS